MSNTAETKKRMEGVCALWKRTSANGKTYFSGQSEDKQHFLTAFYNTTKKNLKEPDLRVYTRDAEGNLSKEPWLSLWCNATKKGKKVLSGKIDGKNVVGFIKADATEKQPYISVYFEEDKLPEGEQLKIEEPKKEAPKKKKEAPKVETPDEELPF